MDFVKPIYETRKLGFREIKGLLIITWLVSGRSGIHLMLAHAKMDPGRSRPHYKQPVSLVASLDLSHMKKGMVSGGVDWLLNFQDHPHRFPTGSTQYPDLQSPLNS